MKLSCIPVLLFLLFFVPTQAQWYVETAVTNNRLAAYSLTGTNATSITPTKVDSFKGFRDTSYGFGYLFSFRSLEERMANDYQTPFFRLGIGLGFEQMNLKTNAIINSAAYPNVYSMAQAQSRLGAYLSPLSLFAKQSIGNKLPQPKFSLDIHGGLGYNYYTSAEQHYGNTLIDLKKSAQFDDAYLSYFIGFGFQYSLNKYVQLYGRYGIDNAFEFTERADNGVRERYQVRKDKLSVGVLVDLPASKQAKDKHLSRVNKLTAQVETGIATEKQTHLYDDSALSQRIQAMEQTIQQQAQKINALAASKSSPLASKLHPAGFTYVLEFAPIYFPIGRATLALERYNEQLSQVADFLQANPSMRLRIIGYTDTLGDRDYNVNLSASRAKTVADYLVEKCGVTPSNIQYIGAGETERFSPDQRMKNRRTELLITLQQ
ncbi:MAG: OmpA family protein [Flavobacteriaceae bacterium]